MKRKNEAGQVLVLAAAVLTVLMLAAGLAIDMGYLRYQKRRMQTAADSAALAAASELQYSTWQSAARTDSAYNGFTDGTNGVTVTPNCPPSTGPHSTASCDTSSSPTSANSYVEVLVSQPQPTFFMRIAGLNSVPLTARAVAHLGSATGCIYGLTTQDDASTFPPQGAVKPARLRYDPNDFVDFDVSALGCTVYDNGNLMLESQKLYAKFVGYIGDWSVDSDGVIAPGPVPISPVSDPLAYLPTQSAPAPCTGMPEAFSTGSGVASPSDPGCGVTVGGTATVEFTCASSPCSYSGPIVIQDSANVTFDHGTYILAQGLSILGTKDFGTGVTVNGTDVTFYNTGTGAIDICIGSNVPTLGCPIPSVPPSTATNTVTLSAPNSGTYAGILMFQDPADTQPGMINGNNTGGPSTTTLQGAFYFPTAQISLISFSTPLDGYAIAVAQTVAFGGNIFIGSNYNSLPNQTSPIKHAVLAE